jgi:hypothetical protein
VSARLAACADSSASLVWSERTGSTMAYRPLEGLEGAVPAGASVLVSGHPGYQGPPSGAVAYFLRHASLYGYLATGFSSFYRLRPDGVYDYALYDEAEPVYQELHREDSPVWAGGGLRLYKLPDSAVYFKDLGAPPSPPTVERTAGQGSAAGLRITGWTSDGYPEFQGWSPPGMGVLADTTRPEGRYPELSRQENMQITVPARGLPERPQVSSRPVTADSGEAFLTIAALREQELSVTVNGEPHSVAVHAGAGTYGLGAVNLPGTIDLANQVDSPVFVKSVAVYEPGAQPDTGDFADSILVRSEARAQGQNIAVSLDYLGPRYQTVIDIYSDDGRTHYGFWELPGSRSEGLRPYRLRFEPAGRQLTLMPRQQGMARVLSGETSEVTDGTYRAYLALWQDGRLVRTVPLFRFVLDGGRLGQVKDGARHVYIG